MRILQVSADYFKASYVDDAITLLQKGEVIAFPTDTLYGVGVDIDNEEAVKKLYEIKERPPELPLILLGASKEDLLPYVLDWTPLAEKLSEEFWPGGLTIILKKSFKVPDYVVSNMDTVGIRVPNHPVILKILEEYGKPIATSSANTSGNASSCTGRHVAEELYNTELALLLDAGKTPESEQSTLIDLSGDEPVILREGIIPAEKLNLDFARLI
jgi:L-threonylcarbamoyladenylate synthase